MRIGALVLCAATLLCAGATDAHARNPKSFLRSETPGRLAFELRDDLTYEDAWKKVFGVLATDFDFTWIEPQVGYIQTTWLYSWTGEYLADYRVRVTVYFPGDRRSVSLRIEAQVRTGPDEWETGVDSRLIGTLKTDLLGLLGRVSR